MAQREIQSVEVSCFIQATEDEARVTDRIGRSLGIEQEPEREELEGHFGNKIVHVKWHLTGDAGWTCFQTLRSLIVGEWKTELERNLGAYIDEHGALYLRLDKQTLMSGLAAISFGDPVRIRVKPRGFMIRGSPERFYERLLELDR